MLRLNRGLLFIIGLLFIFSILGFSLYHHFVMNDEIPVTEFLYKDGMPVDRAPFPPSKNHWMGTDQFGSDLMYKIVQGAKFTIGLAVIISLLRVSSAFVFGFLLSLFKRIKWVTSLNQSFYYLPVALVCYFLLKPVISSGVLTFGEKAIFEIIILTLIAIPTTSVLIAEEIKIIKSNEFIIGARVIGGNSTQIFIKHVLPHLAPKIGIIFMQQIIAALILLAHLGLLSVFFGGTITREYGEEEIALSLSNEWSGLVGTYFYQLRLAPWLLLFPVLFFGLTILSFNFILEGLKKQPLKTVKFKQDMYKFIITNKVDKSLFKPVTPVLNINRNSEIVARSMEHKSFEH
jgi:peptide/nickel transport system permease protein